MADESAVQRLVARTAARDQRHLAGLQCTAAHELVLGPERHDIRMRGTKAVKTFPNHRLRRIDQFLHKCSPLSVVVARQARKATREIGQHLVKHAVLLGVT